MDEVLHLGQFIVTPNWGEKGRENEKENKIISVLFHHFTFNKKYIIVIYSLLFIFASFRPNTRVENKYLLSSHFFCHLIFLSFLPNKTWDYLLDETINIKIQNKSN